MDLINRNDFALNGAKLGCRISQDRTITSVWDGSELQPEIYGNNAILSFRSGAARLRRDSGNFATLHRRTAVSFRDGSNFPASLSQVICASGAFCRNEQLEDRAHKISGVHAGRHDAKFPQADFRFAVSGIEIEGGNSIGVDVQMPWEDSPRRSHQRPMHLKAFFYRPLSRDQRAVQKVSRCHSLPSHKTITIF